MNTYPGQYVAHPKFERAYAKLLALCLDPKPGRVILLTGPTGTGKTLLTELFSKIHNVNVTNSTVHDVQPVVRLDARNNQDKAYFSFRDLFWDALEDMEHPIVSRTVSPNCQSTGRLVSAYAKAIIARKTMFVVIDEAQHIQLVQGGDRNARKILDSLKCFAAQTNTVLILSGAYPLLNTIDLSPHLVRRTRFIVMHRYYADREGDRLQFAKLVEMFCQKKKNIDFGKVIKPILGAIYEESLGVFGIAEDLIDEIALELSLQEIEKPNLESVKSIMEKCGLAKCIRDEIEDGERYLKSRNSGHKHLDFIREKGQRVIKKPKDSKRKRKATPKDFTKDSVFQ